MYLRITLQLHEKGIIMKFFQKLKKRWNIDNNFQVMVILLVFALTGFSTLYTHRLIDLTLGISDNTPFLLKFLVFTLLILPIYSLLLYTWGTILGQRFFFSNFIKFKIGLIFKNSRKA